MLVDVTERRRTEEVLREKARELEEKNRHLECLFTLSHLIERHEELGERFFAMVAETVGSTLIRTVPPVVEIEVDSCVGKVAKGGGGAVIDFRHPVQAHGVRRGEIRVGRAESAPPLVLDAEETNLVGAVAEHLGRLIERWDVTQAAQERQLKLIQADKLASLGVMVAGVAHEINNPLNVILLNASLLGDVMADVMPLLDGRFAEGGDFSIEGLPYSEMRASLPELLRGILDGSERIKSITMDLRDATPRQMGPAQERVDVNQAVGSALQLCAHIDKRFLGRVGVAQERDLPNVRGDRRRLEQVLVNLFRNAWQSLRGPEARIIVAAGVDEGAGMVWVEVRDEGCGMSPEVLGHIKEPFFTTRRDQGGSGLGVAISNNIAEDMGGGLDFESVEGQGTTARLRMPVPRGGGREA